MPETANVEEDKEKAVVDDGEGCITMLPDATLPEGRSSLPSPAAAAADGEDRISALPDMILHEVLSFLSSQEAVRTCLLATRWRDVWKSVPDLRINISSTEDYSSATALAKFVNHLLLLRDPAAALRQCVISTSFENLDRPEYEDREQALQCVEQWIQYAVSCKVQKLRVEGVCDSNDRVELSQATLISKHLRTLHLYSFRFEGRSLDLSSCDALEVLVLQSCDISPENIFPKSLQHLSINLNSTFLSPDTRTSVSAPSIVTLALTSFRGWTPLFESMPLLETAYISSEYCYDCCANGNYYGDCGDHSCKGCYAKDHDSSHCVILDRLSGVTYLTLMTEPIMFIFRKDFKWHPMFSNLKTLSLREWCVVPDFCGLLYFLQHSPVLEKLTLQFALYAANVAKDVEIDESYSPAKQFMASKHLKVVKIKCKKEDEMIRHVLKILCTHGVPRENIHIQSFAWAIQLVFNFMVQAFYPRFVRNDETYV